ncbi:MAG: alanine racemase [Clostridia bacterium]|nr:alanine racemase [Clostridia bacterium]
MLPMRVYAEVSLKTLDYNVNLLLEKINNNKITAVVKANGYGHGAVEIAHHIEDKIELFAVATVEEGMELIESGIKKPIIMLNHVFDDNIKIAVSNHIVFTVGSLEYAEKLNEIAKSQKTVAKVHIKIDTGMGRIGFQPTEKSIDEIKKILNFSNLDIEGIMTHFSKSDECDKTFSHNQEKKFNLIVDELKNIGFKPKYIHSFNSAATMSMDLPYEYNMVRAGIMLYGLNPSYEVSDNMKLKPVMSLYSHIVFLKTLEAGETISYGATFVTKKRTKIATVPVGYADGYPRSLSNKGEVLIKGHRCAIIGKICMDQMMVDVSEIDDVEIGDKITLVGKDKGEEITFDEIGEKSGRFNYETICLLNKRIPRIYID